MKKLLTMIASTVLLAGCLIPEKFDSSVNVASDGSYTFDYKGTAAHPMAAAALKQTGHLSPQDEASLKHEADSLPQKVADVRSASYLGNARYQLDIHAVRKAGQPLQMLEVFNITADKSGLVTIASPVISAKDKKDLSQLGMAVNGTLSVSLPRNAVVVAQNATSTPTLGFGSYKWNIGDVGTRPMLQYRLN
ncbi:MAG: hypothetical protein JO142_16280 [Burkholderiales bacterium]|nr:hypothetical protein [Burkholderiales bacterium]